MNAQGSVVLITGAAGNLGRALAATFDVRGARLVLMDRRADALSSAYGEPGATRMFAPVDLADFDATEACVRTALSRFERIDALCNLTGGFRTGASVHEVEPTDWQFLLDINVGTLLNIVRAVVPHMLAQGGGRIVNVGAYAALKGAAHMGAYAVAKSAVIRLTESMSAELREKNINVNCVLPTVIDTPENRAAMPNADPSRWVAPADLAEVIAFLASPAARAIHGAAIPVTGLS
jgi:NAD(P)-dependent dehydrogenase (short-subunit alcohol dehydrogenase family)